MPTRTSPRTARTTRTPASTGRFARSSAGTTGRGTAGRGTPRRGAPPSRYGMASGVLQRRRTPQTSGLKGALGGLGGMLPSAGRARAKATPSSKKGKAGGFALITAAAGFAFSNRDKLTQMIKQRGGSQSQPVAPATPVTPPPATSP